MLTLINSTAETASRPSSPDSITLTRDDIKELRTGKILGATTYVFFAIRLDYGEDTDSVSINIEDFCDDWDIGEAELLSAIASLQKKGVMGQRAKQLELDLFPIPTKE